uniref:Beta-ketoacyl-[acyl-carrier-protein] synthase III C-terminal domain-containing protein n=1 Tax=Lotharella oceanica TaxID=641309 RepID=A0A7S2X9F9_9EUKA
MNGKEVYKFATSEVPRVINEALGNAGLTTEDIDYILLHQANIRIMEVVAKKLGLSMDQVIRNIDEYGNTSAGSMPLALDEAVRSGKVKEGDVIAFAGFGAGLSWGASIVRWGGQGKPAAAAAPPAAA